MRSYQSSLGTSKFALGVVAVIEILMLGFTVINPSLYQEYLWRYRGFYLSLLIVVVSLFILVYYLSKDFTHRFRILNVVNPLSAAFFFGWSVLITYNDFLVNGIVDPTVFMTFSLSVPSCFFMLPNVYGVIAIVFDAIMLFVTLQSPNGSTLMINMIIYFVFQFVLGISILRVKMRLTTEIIKTEEQRDEIERLSKAQNLFFSSMSHEIRTPINAVLGMDEIILRDSKEKETLEYARDIHVAGTTLLGLINDILDFSKIGAGKMELAPVKYETATIFYDLSIMIGLRAEEKGLSFITDIDEMLPSEMYGDDVKIKQVITNLLTNAVKYTREGSVTLKVSYKKVDDQSIDLYVSVSDTGIGIKKEDIEKLYGTFERIVDKENRKIEGTGLGMTIVTNELKLMDSKLDVSSEYKKGSVFSFVLRQRVEDWKPMGDYRAKDRTDDTEKDLVDHFFKAPGTRILVVDDEKMNLKVFVGLLKNSEISIDTATGGQEAIEKMRTTDYNCVFLDHQMPGMDGIETIGHLYEDEKLRGAIPPIIALTANALEGAREMYMEKGFSDYLTKPIDTGELILMLKKYLPDAEKEDQLLEFSPVEESEEEIFEFSPEEAAPAMKGDKNTIINELKAIGLNADAGIGFAADDTDFYFELLGDYCREYIEKKQVLDNAFLAGDIKTYGITVHAIKSISRSMGADHVSEAAKKLEEAAREGDTRYIKEKHQEFLNEYQDIVGKLQEII